jgi:hypothetical protein
MYSIPGNGVIGGPNAPILPVGPIEALAVLGLVGMLAAFALLIDRARQLVRVRLHCPERGRPARVVFRITRAGRPDVRACSLFRGRKPTCDHACLDSPLTP